MVKFLLKDPEIFQCDFPKIYMLKEKIPIKYVLILLKDKNRYHKDMRSILEIFLSLLNLLSNYKMHSKNSNYKSVLSLAIINFAENSRIYSGECLLK